MNPEAMLQLFFVRWLEREGLLFTASMAGNLKISRFAAVMKKRLGCKAGVPDIMIFEPRGNYHGLFIELKAGKNTASDLQKEWRDALNKRGYCAVIMPSGLEFHQAQDWLIHVTTKYLLNSKPTS
jgi:hypothetical protein